jgi:hypothetical protein
VNNATPIVVRKSVYSRCLELLHGAVSELTCSKAHHVAPAYLPKLHKRVCHMSHIPSSFIECASDLRRTFANQVGAPSVRKIG